MKTVQKTHCQGQLLTYFKKNYTTCSLTQGEGKLAGLHSVSINLKYRITLELIITENEIIPINVGDHDEVY